jgi:hypothetical protein
MNKSQLLIHRLSSIRNQFGKKYSTQKLSLLTALTDEKITSKKALHSYYDSLLFLLAYPDNRAVYEGARRSLQQLELSIQSNQHIKNRLYNSGIAYTELCAAFSFEVVKWMRKKYRYAIHLKSVDADDGQIRAILCVVMPRIESEILLDANENWRSWLKKTMSKGEDMLDRLLANFDEADMRPDVRDELWGALGINVEINFSSHLFLPASLVIPYFHRSLIRKNQGSKQPDVKPVRVKLDEKAAEHIIACARMILVQHLREIDPISFTDCRYVSYHQLPRGLSIALMGMVPLRRSPVDCYMGYVVFKNGLPVAYAGSWILFDSGRIGLNIFPAYRGGESKYIFEQVLKLHSRVYGLNRFSVDPYQIGKENKDGIDSGSFWIYYHAGFRPLRKDQQQLAETEALKIKSIRGYRSPGSVLKKLADSRMELILQRKPVRFDATDLSRAFSAILKTHYENNHKIARDNSFMRLAKMLQIENYHETELEYILKNWCVLLFGSKQQLQFSSSLKKILKKLFELKAKGSEEEYISLLQRTGELRKSMENLIVSSSLYHPLLLAVKN